MLEHDNPLIGDTLSLLQNIVIMYFMYKWKRVLPGLPVRIERPKLQVVFYYTEESR